MVEYRKNAKNESIWLENFGEIGVISQQTNLFIKPDLMTRYEKAHSKLKEKYGIEKLKNWKKNHLDEKSKGSFSDHKSIKVNKIFYLYLKLF